MKKLLIILCLFAISTSFKSDNSNSNEPNKSRLPCNYLYSDNQSTNSDDIIQIKLTDLQTNQVYTFGGLIGSGYTYLDQNFCSNYDIEITVSVGGTSSSVGIKANLYFGSPTIIACEENIIGIDGYKVNFSNVNFNSYGPGYFEFYLKNGGCN